MGFPEHAEQCSKVDDGRVKDHPNDFVVAGESGADFLVGGIRGIAAGVSRRGGKHAAGLPKTSLRAPKATEPEQRELHAVRKRRLDRVAVDEMLFR